jgi:CRISPR-associated protein Cmr1
MSLVELELQLETPLFAGGHEPLRLDELWILRPSEIKGVWRWWARALAAGALYDAGQLKGESRERQGLLKAPTRDEANNISKIVGLKMGLGYADPQGMHSTASSYVLITEPIENIKKHHSKLRFAKDPKTGQKHLVIYDPQTEKELPIGLQRLILLAMGHEREERWEAECLTPGARFKLRVEERLPVDRKSAEAALAALSLALTFSGFGKGGRRGLGCFRVVRATGEYAALFDAGVSVADKVTRAVNAARRVAEVRADESGAGELPPLPLVSARDLVGGYAVRGRKLRPFQVIEVRGGDASRLLEELHNFFLRGVRAKKLLGSYREPDALRENWNAWVLGLPREQKKPKQGLETGYAILGVADRRPSPFFLAVHEGVAYLSVFVSADWPAVLWWRDIDKIRGRQRKKKILIDEMRVISAFATAIKEFVDYAERSGFEVKFVWP